MRLISLLFLLFCSEFLKAQNTLEIIRIDSLKGAISEKAVNKKFEVVQGTLLLEGNKNSSIRFHLQGNKTEMIVVESNLKENVTLYYFDDGRLMHVVNYSNGNYNEVESSFYCTNNTAYEKERSGFKKVNPEIFTAIVSSYFDLFKEQLKAK